MSEALRLPSSSSVFLSEIRLTSFNLANPSKQRTLLRVVQSFFLLLMSSMTDGGLMSMAGSFPGTSSDVPEFDREVELETSRGVLSPCGPSLLSWLDDADAFRFLVGEPE
jgi:hypothetical protein